MIGPEASRGLEEQNTNFSMAEKKAATKAMLEAPIVVLSDEARDVEKSEKVQASDSIFRLDENGLLTTDRYLPDEFEATDEEKEEIAAFFSSFNQTAVEEIKAMTIDEIRSRYPRLPKNFYLEDFDTLDFSIDRTTANKNIDKYSAVLEKLRADCFSRVNTEAKKYFESDDLSIENGAYLLQNLGYEQTRLDTFDEQVQDKRDQLIEVLRLELDYLRGKSANLTEKDETELDENYDYSRPGFRREAFRILGKSLLMDETKDEALSVITAALGKHEIDESEKEKLTGFISSSFLASDRKNDLISLKEANKFAASILENPSNFEKFKEETPGEVGIVMCNSEKTRAEGLELLGTHLGDAIKEQLIQGDPGVEDSEVAEMRKQIAESLKSISATGGDSAIYYLKYLERATEGSEAFQLLLALEETGTLDLAKMDEKNQFIPGSFIRALDYMIGQSPPNDEYFDQLITKIGNYKYSTRTNNIYCYNKLREVETDILVNGQDPSTQAMIFSRLLSNNEVKYIKDRSRIAAEGILGSELIGRIDFFLGKYKKLLRKEGLIASNIESIIMLEKTQPGITEFLEKEQGIEDFGRYPLELLLDQYQLREDTNKPYGVMLMPRSDHNGAFHQKRERFDDFYEQLKNLGYNLRIVEASSKFEIGRHLLKLDKKYAGKDLATPHKFSFALIGGHGTAGSIQFGQDGYNFSSKESQSLELRDLIGHGVQRAFGEQFFEHEPTIILSSCTTGALETESGEHGIGRQISKISGAYVIAPNKPTNINKISVEAGSDGRLHFNVDYWREDDDMHYAAGQYEPQSEEESPE